MPQIKIIKIAFTLTSLLLSFLMWSRFDVSLNTLGLSDVIMAAILLVLSAGLFILSMFLFSDKTPFFVFCAFLFMFLVILGVNLPYILVVLLSSLLFYSANSRIKYNLKNRIKISFHSALVYGVPTIITTLALLVAFASFFYPYDISGVEVQKKSFSYITPLTTGFIKMEFPFYEKEMSLDDLIITSAVVKNGLDPSQVNIEQIKFSLKGQLDKQKKEISEKLGIKIKGDETLDDLLVLSANSYLDKYIKTNQSFVPIVIAIVTFFTIKSFGFILNRLSILVAWVLFNIMLHFKLARKETVQVEKEKILI